MELEDTWNNTMTADDFSWEESLMRDINLKQNLKIFCHWILYNPGFSLWEKWLYRNGKGSKVENWTSGLWAPLFFFILFIYLFLALTFVETCLGL